MVNLESSSSYALDHATASREIALETAEETTADRLALVSIHDVMPETLAKVAELLSMCRKGAVKRITMLVVPGKDWSEADLAQLKAWADTGIELAGHGWLHHCDKIQGFYHRLHSALISRDVAEHLTLDETGIRQLLDDCADWFSCHQLSVPELYVPPAWALGSISMTALRECPFQMVETLAGVIDVKQQRLIRLPLTGYEADTLFRAVSVSSFNRMNWMWSKTSGRPIRVSIHPNDHHLKLKRALQRDLNRPINSVGYGALRSLTR